MAQATPGLVTTAKPQKGGAVSSAPLGTAIPADAAATLNAAFVKLGYVSEDGLTNGNEKDSEDIKEWGGDTVLSVGTGRKETFQLTFIQSLDPDVLKEVYGQENVKIASGNKLVTVDHNAKDMPHRVFVIEMIMAGGYIKRIVIPDGQVTEVGEVVYKAGEAVGYETTITAYPSTVIDGSTAREYIAAVSGGVLPA